MSETVVAVLALHTAKAVISYVVPKGLDKLLEAFWRDLEPDSLTEHSDTPRFVQIPSSALLGLGRCGTNICLEVSKRLDMVIQAAQAQARYQSDKPDTRIAPLPLLSRLFSKPSNRVLFEPVILLADLDGRAIKANLQARAQGSEPGYRRRRYIDLRWLYQDGAGNVPAYGQFLARLALVIDPTITEESGAPDGVIVDWKRARAYFLDTVAHATNTTRLRFFVFAAGGGTGASLGMEMGQAQRFSYLKQLSEGAPEVVQNAKEWCSLGFAVLPGHSNPDEATPKQTIDATLVNAGRALTKYLAGYERAKRAAKGQDLDLSCMPFDALFLISNRAMTLDGKISASEAVGAVNEYISQQIFNLLTAQALPDDFSRGKSINTVFDELEHLDPSDLKNTLSGLVAVGYAEEKAQGDILPSNLILRAISPPTLDKDGVVQGISLCPANWTDYSKAIADAGANESAVRASSLARLARFTLFGCARTVMAVLSCPAGRVPTQAMKENLQTAVANLTPEANIRRFAVLKDVSEVWALSLFFSQSAALAVEVNELVHAFAQNCMREADIDRKTLQGLLSRLKKEPITDEDTTEITRCVRPIENIGPVIAMGGEGRDRKVEAFEKRAQELGTSLELDQCLVTRDDLVHAFAAIARAYRHRGLIAPEASEVDDVATLDR